MVDREDRRDRMEARLVVAREGWMQFEDRGIEVIDQIWSTMKLGWEWAQKRPMVLRWGIVVCSVFLSMVIGLSLHRTVTASSQLLLLLPAVMVSALYSGMFAGTIAALLGAAATIHWKMVPEPGSFAPDAVGLALYAVACCILLGLSRAQQVQQDQTLLLAETLEERVEERTSDLQAANQELMDFCYSISHDLRAPMRNIVGSSRILLDENRALLDAESRERLEGLANSANLLSAWVDDLLGYAKIGQVELKPEWVNITQMTDEICTQLKEDAWGFSSVTVRVHPNLVTTGDKVLVRMALRNVFENAFKYAKQGSPLVIEVGERRSRTASYISIRDNGIGFEQQYAKRIFEPFQRLHRDSEYTGSGIGLANVKRIVERHGGEVLAEASPMVGAIFLLRFGSGKTESHAIIADST